MNVLFPSEQGIEARVVAELPRADLLDAHDVYLSRVFLVNPDYSLQAVWGQSQKKIETLPNCEWLLTDDGRVYAKLLSRRYKNDDSSKGPRWLHRAENLWPEMRSKLRPTLTYLKSLAPTFTEGVERYVALRKVGLGLLIYP